MLAALQLKKFTWQTMQVNNDISVKSMTDVIISWKSNLTTAEIYSKENCQASTESMRIGMRCLAAEVPGFSSFSP